MDVTSMATEELGHRLQEDCIRDILSELRRREPDPASGVVLVPGPGGCNCPGNGLGPAECCCDECDWFLECFAEEQN